MLAVPRTRTVIASRAFSLAVPTVCNSLPLQTMSLTRTPWQLLKSDLKVIFFTASCDTFLPPSASAFLIKAIYVFIIIIHYHVIVIIVLVRLFVYLFPFAAQKTKTLFCIVWLGAVVRALDLRLEVAGSIPAAALSSTTLDKLFTHIVQRLWCYNLMALYKSV